VLACGYSFDAALHGSDDDDHDRRHAASRCRAAGQAEAPPGEASGEEDEMMLANAGRQEPARTMTSHGARLRQSYLAIGRALEVEWQALSARYLPISPRDSVWRISRGPAADDAE